MAKKDPLVSPILKWVGGKRQLLDVITPMIPKHSTYYEPFIGGGAVLFHTQPGRAVINDSNPELINVYNTIKNTPEQLLVCLREHQEKNCEEYFYYIRGLDRQPEQFGALTEVQRAARTIYLNKTCYNGLYRVNNAGEFNAPWGKYENPNIVNETTINAVNNFFNRGRITIKCGDYQEALKGIRKGAFVYFDPPYMPLSATASFTGYTAGGFGTSEQEKLKKFCGKLDKRGVKFLLSNSFCPYIVDLYKGYKIEEVYARRSVNAVGDNRGEIREVLVRNYE